MTSRLFKLIARLSMVMVLSLFATFSLVTVASASHADDPRCTKEGGRTTCTVVTQETVTTTQSCEVGNSGRQGTQEGTVTTTTTTTTVYRGSSHNVESQNTQTEEGPFTPTGNCKNNPGPQK